MKSLLALPFLLAAPLAAQTVQYSTTLDQPHNLVSWSVSASIGTVNVSPANFRLGGTLELLTDRVNAPFSAGALNGAVIFTAPSTLSGEIPNPLPFLPPLATFDLKNLQFHLAAPTFQIDPLGNFTAIVTLTTTAGTNTLGGLFGSGTESIAGVSSTPTAVSGTLTQNGSVINLHIDMNVQVTLTDPGTGISFTLSLAGPMDSLVDSNDAGHMHLELPLPMLGGNGYNLQLSHATPAGTVYLAGSLAGLGSVNIGPLGVTAGIAAPAQAGIATADALGNASFSLSVPPNLIGRSVWLQALETGRVSNVAGSWIE